MKIYDNDTIMEKVIEIIWKVVLSMLSTSAIFCLQSCQPDGIRPVYEAPVQEQEGTRADYVVGVSGIVGEEMGTKSILGTDSDSSPFIKDSGYQVLAFNRRAGILEAVVSVDSRTAKATLKLNRSDTYDFFVVGNLWFLDSSGKKAGWDTFFRKTGKYPAKAADMNDASLMPYYRFDGGALGSTGLCTEKFSDVATCGIPYSGQVAGVTYDNSRNGVSVSVKRLFSKVTLTVDHSGLVDDDNVDAFVNKSIRLRQVNCRVHPFIEGVAAAADDILEDAEDYEESPANGASKTFVFYVPENCGGTYDSVTKSSDKVPSAAGSKSGTVTYLEFVGELDPAKAGGYGGTLKYQFCLGENATSDYNVVRNSNYKVTLGFKPESLFGDVEWKLDKGEGLADTRVLGLSEDAAGTKRLKEDGTQVIAVRPANGSSKKKELYVFFNHSGGTANELTSYVDEYKSEYKPADATRSALQITFDKNNADAIKCSYDKSTGKLSFWTDSPTALTPGHEYTVTLKLLPGNKTVTAKVKTVVDLGVTADVSGFLVGMKRKVAAKGFLGSNISLKVVSGGENVLRYSNSAAKDGGPGTDKYVTKSGVSLTGMSAFLYAYRPGSVKISVSSDDTFNDGSFPFDVNVSKPKPRYDKIKGTEPIWNAEKKTVEYGSRIVLPFDGTPVDVPAYYTADGWSETPVTVGDKENQFDPGVYAQLLDFVFTTNAPEFIGKDPETLRIYLKKWKAGNGSFFATRLTYGDFADNPTLLQKIFSSKINLAPRSTEIFSKTEDKFDAFLTTIRPGFFDVTQRETGSGYKPTSWEKVDFNSDYFNYWDSAWDFRDIDEIDDDVIISRWPSIRNRAPFSLMGCDRDDIAVEKHGANSGYVNTDGKYFSTDTGGNMYFEWRFEPSKMSDFIGDYGTSIAPYGDQYSVLTVKNRWSGETFGIESPRFSLKYTVSFCTYGVHLYDDSEAKLYVGAPLSFAQMLLERASHSLEYSPMINIPLSAFPEIRISCTSLSGFSSSAWSTPANDLYFFIKNSGNYSAGNVSEIFADYGEFIRTNAFTCGDSMGYGPYDIVPANQFQFECWDTDGFSATMEYGWGLPYEYCFFGGNRSYSELPESLYSNKELYNVIKFQFDRNGGAGGIRGNTGTRPKRIGWIEM